MKTKSAEKDALFPLLHDYLLIYLPNQREVSRHTVLAYRKSLEDLLDYVKDQNRIPLYEVTFAMLTKDVIFSFLDHLEKDCGFSSATRNNRFAAIRAFMALRFSWNRRRRALFISRLCSCRSKARRSRSACSSSGESASLASLSNEELMELLS